MSNTGRKYGSQIFDTITSGSTGNWDDELMEWGEDSAVLIGTAQDLDLKDGIQVSVEVDATGGQAGDLTIEFFKSSEQTHGQKALTLTMEAAEAQSWEWNFSSADYHHMLVKLTNSTGDDVTSTVQFTPFDIPAAS